ncbi:MOSC domain-containing protein YiiM [Prosthecobacter fusiformis]|uniref:MOSC domain-containing protein YiiM n=1 Tax=Prosthecobacter fusiformis TaxID=48464 RepID=A0A4V3FI88_9BACT|nr:MOSC domain-containing protein [Prosthecobacter fusiformis]TDU81533.1 MOSC domain-containing protein YiiM [Prosthecobacter fusiformis]
MMKLLSIQISAIQDIPSSETGSWWDKPWSTGFYKQSVLQPLWLGYEGLKGDQQADRRYHGGSEKAVCVYGVEHYPYWQEKLGLAEMPHGAFGENFTTEGLLEKGVCIGDVYSLGGALLQVSQPRQPCWKLARRWQIKDLTAQVERTGYTGFYFRVLRHGTVHVGSEFTLMERSFPQWTIALANEIMHHRRADKAAARELADCPLLSASWKDSLWSRSIVSSEEQEMAKKLRTDNAA